VARAPGPNWQAFYQNVAAQYGYFLRDQAIAARVSHNLLHYYASSGQWVRIGASDIYRVASFPEFPHHRLVSIRLWSKSACVFSHETALEIHGLCQPQQTITITMPAATANVFYAYGPMPYECTVDFCDLKHTDIDPTRTIVPVTTPTRAIIECIWARLPKPLVNAAWAEAQSLGLMEPFGDERINYAMTYGVDPGPGPWANASGPQVIP